MKEIGVIKWYHDKATDGRYGFIECPKYKSIFFHKSELQEGVQESSLTEGILVLFNTISSTKNEEKWKAVDVSLVSTVEESKAVIQVYFDSFLAPIIKDSFSLYLRGLYTFTKKQLDKLRHDESIQEIYKNYKSAVIAYLEPIENQNKSNYFYILEKGLSLFPDFDKSTFELIKDKISNEIHFELWDNTKTYVFPIAYCLEKKVILNSNRFQGIAKRTKPDQLVELFTLQMEELLNQDFKESLHEIKLVLESAKKSIPSHFKEFYGSISHNFSSQIQFDFWLEKLVDDCPSKIIHENWSLGDLSLVEKSFKLLPVDQKIELAKLLHQTSINKIAELENILEYFTKFYSLVKGNISDIFQFELMSDSREKFSDEERIQLWLESYDNQAPMEILLAIIEDSPGQLVEVIFQKANPNEINQLMKGLLFLKWDKISEQKQIDILIEGVKSLRQNKANLDSELSERAVSLSSTSFKLQLWLEDFHDFFDFELYKPWVITMPSKAQKLFLKKIFYYIHIGRTSISIDDLTSLNVIDYSTAEESKAIDGFSLDYSISIVLNCIRELSQRDIVKDNFEAKRKIVEIIVSQLKDPKDILEVHGFFDKCKGRAFSEVSKVQSNDFLDPVQFSIVRKEDKIPKNHIYCDGRLATEKGTGIEAKDENSGFPFWWCANQKCFNPCRSLKSPEDWRTYAIQDFLQILNISYLESELVTYLSLINKVNRFLEHLKCRNCSHILRPLRQSNYAFYGVNHFHCTNDECLEKGKEIYITHCLNGRCDSTIDSRDTVKCRPENFEQDSCGWYICNECHACCSTEKLNGRKYVTEVINKSQYKCHSAGHRDLGIICCDQCGHQMETFQPQIIDFNRILTWFINNKDKSNQVVKSGKNKFGKWWFRIKAKDGDLQSFYKKLLQYKKVGFNVPELAEGNEYQMIAEPINMSDKRTNHLECLNCGNMVDLNEFPEKRAIMKGYHEKINL